MISQRKKLTNKMRRAGPEEKELLSQQKRGLTDQITRLRRDLKLAAGLENRSLDMVKRIETINELVDNKKLISREKYAKTENYLK